MNFLNGYVCNFSGRRRGVDLTMKYDLPIVTWSVFIMFLLYQLIAPPSMVSAKGDSALPLEEPNKQILVKVQLTTFYVEEVGN